MKSKLMVFSLALVTVFLLSGCGMFGGGGSSSNPTPTLPLPTNAVVATAEPNANPNANPSAVPGAVTEEASGATAIGGDVFNDSNGNGAKDDGEPPIAGVALTIANGDCPGTMMGATNSTADTPGYKFEGLTQGTYCVAIDATNPQNAAILGQGAWTYPTPAQGTISDKVNLTKKSKENVNFGWTFTALGGQTPSAEQPTAAAAEATVVPGASTPEPMIPTPTAYVQPTAAPQACVYRANFVQDVTIPDGQLMLPGTNFVKTWRVVNAGTCSWGPGSGVSTMQFVGGNQMGAPNTVPIPNAIPVGATADLSVQMTAPQQPGRYKSEWKLRADDGTLIGVGPSNVALYADIRVQAAPPPQPTAGPVQPTAVPPPAPGQTVTFAPGATEAEVQGQLPANGIATYIVGAQAGQNMQLSLSSNSNSARIAVMSPTGVPLPPQRGNPEGTYWQGNLPTNGNYVIQVLAGNAAPTANYSLDITIPVRIQFAPGAISASVNGTTSDGRIVTYLLKASGGQTMTVNLVAPANSAGITIYGLDDGQPLVRSQSGATSFTGQLPATQDYVIQVVPFGNTQVNYTLNVTVQ